MAEPQPPEGPVNGGSFIGAASEIPVPGMGSKRQRRPSVRLGEIGGQPASLSYESYVKRSRQWNPSQKEISTACKSSKTRPLTNLGNGFDSHETLETEEDKNNSADCNLDLALLINRKGKDLNPKRGGGGVFGGTKRVRSNWGAKIDEKDGKFNVGEDREEWYRGFDPEGSESPLKEHNQIHSLENTTVRVRVSESRDHEGIELDGRSDTDVRDWKCGTRVDRNGVNEKGGNRSIDDGVRSWLDGLGLGQYVPVFEIHEVDEEVLPLLTLEDLKDMGMHAVGSRRKMYCAIQKLAQGFT